MSDETHRQWIINKLIERKSQIADESKKNHFDRYIEYVKSCNYRIVHDNFHKAITPQKPVKYYGEALYHHWCLLRGDRNSYKGFLRSLGINTNIENESIPKKSKAKREVNKKSEIRKSRTKKTKTPKISKPKELKFSDESNAFAKFNRKYKKITFKTAKDKTVNARPDAMKKAFDSCSLPGDAKDIIDAQFAQMFKILLVALYLNKYTDNAITRDTISEYGPILFNGTWKITKVVVNYAASYLLLKENDNGGTFGVYKPLITLFDEWIKYPKNKIHPIILKEVEELENESESEEDTGHDDDTQHDDDGTEHKDNTDNIDNNNNVDNNEEIEEIEENEENEEDEQNIRELKDYLIQFELDEDGVMDKLFNRKRVIKLHELAKLDKVDLKEYLVAMGLDAIERLRFFQMITAYSAEYVKFIKSI